MILHKITNVVSTNYKTSTIFKTYETDLDGINNKLGFNKRSFAEWGTQVKQSFDEAGGGLKGFVSALSTAFNVKNNDKEFKKYNEQIVTKNNIDDYLPKLDETSAENQLKYLQDWQKAVDKGTKTWDSYFKTCKDGRSYLIDFVQNTDLQKASTEDLIKANEAARQSALAHNAALKQQTLGAKAATVGLNLLKTALNTAAFMAITTAIITVANTIITKFSDIVNAYEDGVKKISDLSEGVKGLKSEQESLNEKLAESQNRLYELQQIKIPSLFEKDEIQHLKEYNEQLKIQLRLKELEIRQKSGEANEAAKKLYGNSQWDDNPYDDFYTEDFELWEQILNFALPSTYVNLRNAFQNATNWFQGNTWEQQTAYLKESESALKYLNDAKQAQANFQTISNNLSKYKSFAENNQSITEEDIRHIFGSDILEKTGSDFATFLSFLNKLAEDDGSYFSQYNANLQSNVENAQNRFDEHIKNLEKRLTDARTQKAGLDPNDQNNSDRLRELDDFISRTEALINNETRNKSFTDVYNNADFSDTVAQLKNLAKSGELTEETFNKIDDIDEFKEALQSIGETDIPYVISSIISKVNESDDSLGNATKSAEDYAKAISDVKESFSTVIKNSGLFEEAEKKLKGGENLSYDEAMSLIAIDPSLAGEMIKTADGYSIAISRLIEANKAYAETKGIGEVNGRIKETNAEIVNTEARISELERKRAEIKADMESGKIKDHIGAERRISEIDEQIKTLTDSVKSGKDAIAAYNILLSELGEDSKAPKTFTDIISGVEEYASKLVTLAKVYNDVKDGNGFDWSSIINNEEFKRTFANCTKTYDSFIKTVSNSHSDISACQEAFNDLVGEYLYASGVLNELTEETREAAVAMLEQNGIANAAEIVDAKLRQLAIARENEADMAELQRKETLKTKTAYLQEIEMSGETAWALLELRLEKIKANAAEVKTKSDIDNLIALATTAGATTETLRKLYYAKRAIGDEDFSQSLYDYGKGIANGKDGLRINGGYDARAYNYYLEHRALDDILNGNINFDPSKFMPETKFDGSDVDSASGSSANTNKEDTKKTFDWIERAIEKVQKAFSRLSNTAKSVYKTFTERNKGLYGEIDLVNKEIKLQEKAYTQYMKKAASVGISSDLANKIQNGAVDISEYDSETAEIIEEYKEWYDKALDCRDAIDELHETLNSLYKERFDNISKDFENQLAQIEHLAQTYNIQIDIAEAKGYLSSVKYYASLQDSQRKSLSALNQELTSLNSAFNEGMKSGTIEEYSDAWYEMKDSINNVTEEIMKGKQQIAEYAKTMREIEWGHFDYLQERISHITQESDFLINLLDSEKLFDDKGHFADEGMAALGLRAQNYNVYLAQADKYAQELLNIEREIANDSYNADLIARREELLKLQQESIVSAEDEKQAMINLVKEGIEKELSALKDLIDSYNEVLDEANDLRDYQKKIGEQAEQIANLKKQISAKAGDTSEEAKANIQKLQVELGKAQEELQESEYERYISEQKKLLNEIYNEYEDALNMRLDDIDVLIAELIGTVNENSGNIAATFETVADDVGYMLSDSFKTIWDNSTSDITSVVSVYGERFTDKLTTVNEALNRIEVNTAAMIKATDTSVSNDIKNPVIPNSPSLGTSNSSSGGNGSSNGLSNSNSNSNGFAKPIRIGGKINAAGAPIYDYVGDTDGKRQVFGNDPIYTVLDEINGYLKVRWHKVDSGITGWFKQSDVKAYKTGGLVNYTGLAQLDGTRSKPEYVLNADETKNYLALNETLKKLANTGVLDNMSRLNPISFVKPPDVGINSVSRAGDTTFGDININIDHVGDYNDLVNKMRSDRRFEKMIKAMTIDRPVGGSSLAKNKYRW